MNTSVIRGADAHAAVASDLHYLQSRTSFPNLFDSKYLVPYVKVHDVTSLTTPAAGRKVSVALLERHPDPNFAAATNRLRLELADTHVEVLAVQVSEVAPGPAASQVDLDKALLEKLIEGVTTPRLVLVDDPAAVSADVIRSYIASADVGLSSIAVLDLMGAHRAPDESTKDQAPPIQPEDGSAGFDFDFESEFDIEEKPSSQPTHQVALNEMLRPGLAVAMETSRLRSFVSHMPALTYPWMVSAILRRAYLDGLQFHRYGTVSPGDSDTWSPAGVTPVWLQEEATGERFHGVTVTVGASNVSREALTGTIDSLLLSEGVALNITVIGLSGADSLSIADAYSATGLVRIDEGQASPANTLVHMGVEAGIVFEPESLRKLLDYAVTLDYSVLRLVTGQSDSKIEVWPTSLLATATRLADDGNIDEFVLNHTREHWHSGSHFGLALASPSAPPATR